MEEWDFVEITCRVEYRGFWRPVISCAEDIGPRGGHVKNPPSSTHVEYRRVVAAADIKNRNETAIRCTARFIRLEWQALRTRPRQDMPEYDYVWTQHIHVVDNVTGLSDAR